MFPLGILLFAVIMSPILMMGLEFSHLAFSKMRLQSAVDQAVLQSAQVLTGHLNAMVGLNQEAQGAFEETRKEFRKLSKDEVALARAKVEALHRYQNSLREEMEDRSQRAYREACETLVAALRRHDPAVEVRPTYGAVIWNGTCVSDIPLVELVSASPETLHYGFIESAAWDPTGYRSGTPLPARPGFIRKLTAAEPLAQFGAIARRKVATPWNMALGKRGEKMLAAEAAAQPFGGNLGRLEPYRTALIPAWALWHKEERNGRGGGL